VRLGRVPPVLLWFSAQRRARDLGGVVGEVGELAHHEVGLERGDRGPQALGVVGVADHGLRPEPLELRDPRGRARHRGDRVARRHEQRHDAEADHAGRPGHEHAHGQAAAASTSGKATTPAYRVSMYSRTAWIRPSRTVKTPMQPFS
jgi:hypothetical protein